jgi:prepilin-type N-terminal cleavage/methylation domain-containing protein/prepilin-type processing-associated H-X9-DG protein
MRQRNAFTLIELLVVVAIIALLVAILLPSLNQARAIAEQTVCLNTTHQWALGFVLYDGDYGGLPLWGAHYPPGAGYLWTMGPYLGYDMDDYADPVTWGFYDYDKAPGVWRCPSAGDRLRTRNEECGDYALNSPNLIGWNPQVYGYPLGHEPFTIAEIPRPSDTLIMGDGMQMGYFYPPFGPVPTPPDMDYDGDGLPTSNFGYDTNQALYIAMSADYGYDMPYNNVAARHVNRSANMVFLDGHGKNLPIWEIMDPERRLWGEDLWE